MRSSQWLGISLLAVLCSTYSFAATAESTGPDKDLNIRVNPLGFIFGAANVQFDIGISDSFTLGPSLSYASVKATSTTTVNGTTTSSSSVSSSAFGVGARANLFLGHSRFTDGWYLGPEVGFASAKAGSTSASGLSVGAVVGYGWFWEKGFNIMFGLGVQYISVDTAVFSVGGVLPAGEFTLGYAF